MKNEDSLFTHHMQARATYCAQLLNAKGGVIELSMWSEKDIEEYLDMYRSTIISKNND